VPSCSGFFFAVTDVITQFQDFTLPGSISLILHKLSELRQTEAKTDRYICMYIKVCWRGARAKVYIDFRLYFGRPNADRDKVHC